LQIKVASLQDELEQEKQKTNSLQQEKQTADKQNKN
jgi:hypothetical protein